jgi:hypothetical protein
MTIVKGNCYTRQNTYQDTCPNPSYHATNASRVTRAGSPYIVGPSSWSFSCWNTPSVFYRDYAVTVQSPASLSVIALLLVLGAIGAAISPSRDCYQIGTECSLPDFWGQQVCQNIYNCRW